MSKTAIILGASGLTGGILLDQIIKDNYYTRIKLFSRSKIEGLPNKVFQFIGDLFEIESFAEDFTGDVVFCCIGTTKSKTSDKNLYKKIDCGIPANASKLAKVNGIETFIVISAMGANKNSRVFYNKTKGEMEQAIFKQNIKNTYVLRPSLINGERNESRFLEHLGIKVFNFLNPLLFGPLEKYQSIKAETIAKAMLYIAKQPPQINPIILSNNIKELLNNKK